MSGGHINVSQVIMLLLFPIGLYFYLVVESKQKIAYQKVFDDFQEQIKKNDSLTQHEKLHLCEEMLKKNGYTILEHTEKRVKGEKKILSMSLLAMSIGVYYVGMFFYLAYYYWIQKPHVVKYEIY